MRFWFDTEFMEDGKTIELLSIGIVSEDNREYYAVNRDADHSKANDWVKANVLPKIDFATGVPRTQIRDEVSEFFLGKVWKPEIWAYYADYDWVALCQLFGRMVDLPGGFPKYCRDIKQLCADLGDPDLPAQDGDKSHHALLDARWNRQAWTFLIEKRDMMENLLAEWLNVPFYESRAVWADWVRDFRPRVEKALSR